MRHPSGPSHLDITILGRWANGESSLGYAVLCISTIGNCMVQFITFSCGKIMWKADFPFISCVLHARLYLWHSWNFIVSRDEVFTINRFYELYFKGSLCSCWVFQSLDMGRQKVSEIIYLSSLTVCDIFSIELFNLSLGFRHFLKVFETFDRLETMPGLQLSGIICNYIFTIFL